MKKFFSTFILALAALTASAQNTMTVTLNSGETETFQMSDVKTIDFVTLEDLSNQYQCGSDVVAIGSVLEWQNVAGTTYYIYNETGITAPASDAAGISIFVPADLDGQEIDLAGADVRLTLPSGKVAATQSGTVKITKKMGVLNVNLNARADGTLLCAQYRGKSTTGFESSQSYTVSSDSGILAGQLTQLWRYDEPTGGAFHFACGDAVVTTPEEYVNGKYAIHFRIAAALYNQGALDLKSNSDNYSLEIYDYANAKTYYANEYTVGTVSTKTVGTNVFFSIDATLTSGMNVKFEYYGATTEATEEQLAGMVPSERTSSNIQVFKSDGKTTTWDKPIITAKKKIYNGMEKFYFVLDEGSSLTNQMLTPLLVLNPSIYNQGVMDLSNMEANTWNIDFAGIQLYSPDNAYMPVPNNGTLSAAFNSETGEYEIKLEVQNYYNSTYGGGVIGQGEIVKLYYKGIPENY